MCKSLTNYFPRDNDFLVTYFGKTQRLKRKSGRYQEFKEKGRWSVAYIPLSD